jgi:hypothetical protein
MLKIFVGAVSSASVGAAQLAKASEAATKIPTLGRSSLVGIFIPYF